MRIVESLPFAFLLAFGVACGGSPTANTSAATASTTSSTSTTGLQIVLDTDAPFATQADFPSRLTSTIQLALDYWGDWSDLNGVTLTISRWRYRHLLRDPRRLAASMATSA